MILLFTMPFCSNLNIKYKNLSTSYNQLAQLHINNFYLLIKWIFLSHTFLYTHKFTEICITNDFLSSLIKIYLSTVIISIF